MGSGDATPTPWRIFLIKIDTKHLHKVNNANLQTFFFNRGHLCPLPLIELPMLITLLKVACLLLNPSQGDLYSDFKAELPK